LAAGLLESGTATVINWPPAGSSRLMYPMALALRTSWASAATTEATKAAPIAIHNDFFMLRSPAFVF